MAASSPAPSSVAATGLSSDSAAAEWVKCFVHDLKLGQPVALKFLPPDVDKDPSRLTQLHTEVRMARQVSHPNVCRVYDIDEVDGTTFLSMWKIVDGEDLGTLLKRVGRFPEERGLEIARQIYEPGSRPRTNETSSTAISSRPTS